MRVDRTARAIAPLPAAELARRLREATPEILLALGGLNVGPADWRFETRDETLLEWNRAEVGPSTGAVWTMVPGPSAGAAVVRLDTIRWSPVEVHRQEVVGHWRVAPRTASLFARAENEAPVTRVLADAVVWRSVPGLGLSLPR